jgi:hypothetical protein
VPASQPRVAAAPRARLVRAPWARRGTIAFTVRCLGGTCAIGATVVRAGTRTLGRAPALTLRAGAERTVTVRLNRTGRRLLAQRGRLRVTVQLTLAGDKRTIPLTLRR